MTTRLTTPLRREIEIDGEFYTVQLTSDGVRISRKRFRGGRTIAWRTLLELAEPDDDEGTAAVARRIQ